MSILGSWSWGGGTLSLSAWGFGASSPLVSAAGASGLTSTSGCGGFGLGVARTGLHTLSKAWKNRGA